MAWKKKGMGNNKGMKSKARKAPAGAVRAPQKAPKVIGKVNVRALANAVARLNCEKKEIGVYSADLTHGQIYTDGTAVVNSGHYLTAGLTFSASNGTSDITRIGDEVMVTGLYNQYQFSQQSNTTQRVRGKIYFFSPRLQSSNATVTVGNFLNPNGFIYSGSGNVNSVYDYMSSRNMDQIRNFKVLRTKTFTISPDVGSLSQKMISTLSIGLKFKKPWKVRFNSAGQVVSGQIYMLIVFDSGNAGSVAPSAGANLTGIAKTDTLSGVQWSYFSKTYFIDP